MIQSSAEGERRHKQTPKKIQLYTHIHVHTHAPAVLDLLQLQRLPRGVALALGEAERVEAELPRLALPAARPELAGVVVALDDADGLLGVGWCWVGRSVLSVG